METWTLPQVGKKSYSLKKVGCLTSSKIRPNFRLFPQIRTNSSDSTKAFLAREKDQLICGIGTHFISQNAAASTSDGNTKVREETEISRRDQLRGEVSERDSDVLP